MTNLEAAKARRAEAAAAMEAGDFAEAARCYAWAAEQFAKVAWEQEGTTKSTFTEAMRSEAVKAIRLRDAA